MQTPSSKAMNRLAMLACMAAACCAPSVQAATNTPLDCPGVVKMRGGYKLTRDATCSQPYMQWSQKRQVFDLGGYALKLPKGVAIKGSQFTIRNGKLSASGIEWSGGSYGALSNVTLRRIGKSGPTFFIEAGTGLAVSRCSFLGISGVALSYYVAQNGTVRDSRFSGNETAVSLQRGGMAEGVAIEHNQFTGNGRAIYLWNEDFGGVNQNHIADNRFQGNGIGVSLDAYWHRQLPPESFPTMQGNRIERNVFLANRQAGILLQVTCSKVSDGQNDCSAQDTQVLDNVLSLNGLKPAPDAPEINDGITARANLWSGTAETPYSYGLGGVTLARNRTQRNADLGVDADGVVDGGGNTGQDNQNPEQCQGVICVGSLGKPSASAPALRIEPTADQPKPFAADWNQRYRHH
jgi:hypothetical protein